MKKLSDEVRQALLAAAREPQTVGDLRQLGLHNHDVQRLIRNRSLQRFHHRYISGSLDEQTARAGCAQAAHPRSVISHRTAAVLRDLRVWTDNHRLLTNPVWLTCEPGKQRRNQKRDDVVLRRADLTSPELQRHRGLLLTSDSRTVVDLARELPFAEAVVTADHALALSVSRAELDDAVRRQSGWPGIQRARSAVAFADPRAESALESMARVVFADAGLPAPVLQAQFWDGHTWMLERVDFWWPDGRTVGEADGLAKFEAATPAERRRLLRRNYERDQRLADRDLELIHFGLEDLFQRPGELVNRLYAAFTRGRRRTGADPIWRTTDPHDPHCWPLPPAANTSF
ncbi:hypothetical protein [Kribbella qitaiheensis]|uniref:hypothetical protein n=1 Tax=Kribbella qitaiheensis TaxID=1544730 RepID=UPI0019D62041|nr:hypothetical protein [Kribbella qitaiheensis]